MGGWKLADLFVSIAAPIGPISTALGAVRQQLVGLANIGGGIGGKLGGMFGGVASSVMGLAGLANPVGLAVAAVAALGAGIAHCTMAAANLRETMDKVGTIFGSSASVITDQAEEMASKFGTVRGEFIEAASNFGAVFKEMGAASSDAAALGNTLTKLGMDMASLDNASNPEVFTALSAALRGEYDPLERYRVFLTAATVAQKAVSMGLADNASHVSESAKKYATLQLILEKTKDAQGDLERTQNSGKNQWREMWGHITNLSASLGTIFLPMFEKVVGYINTWLGVISTFWSKVAAIAQKAYEYFGWVETEEQRATKNAKVDAQNETAKKDRAAASATVPGADKEKKEAKGWTGDVVGWAARIQEAAWGTNKDQIARDQLAQQKVTNKMLEDIRGKLSKPVPVLAP